MMNCACQFPTWVLALLGLCILIGGVCIGMAIGAMHMINQAPSPKFDAQRPRAQDSDL